MIGTAGFSLLISLDPVRVALAAQTLDPLPASGLDVEGFMALSVVLAGHDGLNATLGQSLFGALEKMVSPMGLLHFMKTCARLRAIQQPSRRLPNKLTGWQLPRWSCVAGMSVWLGRQTVEKCALAMKRR
jgi:hypothetical protein